MSSVAQTLADMKVKDLQNLDSDTASVNSDEEPLRRTTANVLQDTSDSEDDDIGLMRTTTVVGPKDAKTDAFQVKNTFIHFEDASEEPGRTQSDPCGQKVPLPRLPQRYPSVSAVPEEREASDSEDSHLQQVPAEELQRHSTYDRFSEEGQLERITTFDYFSERSIALPQRDVAEEEDELQRLSTFDHFSNATALPALTTHAAGLPALAMPSFMPVMLGVPFSPWTTAPGIPFGARHSFHKEVKGFGDASLDLRQFTKGSEFEGRLSVLSGSEVQRGGVQTYLAQFSAGEMSKADGIGFVFASRVPCAKNIQKIVSVFVNQKGRICMRVFGDILRAKAHVKQMKIGDWVEMTVDLDNSLATFKVWSANTSSGALEPRSTAEFNFGQRLAQQEAYSSVKLDAGHFACVVQNVGVTVTLGS